jgi:hypothetical protein
LIRTTFWTRHSHEVRPDDDQGAEKVHALLAKNHEVLALGKHYDQAILEQGLNKDHSIFDQDQGNTHTVLGKGQDKVQDQVHANETELEALNQDTALEDGKLEFTEKGNIYCSYPKIKINYYFLNPDNLSQNESKILNILRTVDQKNPTP